MVSAAFMKKYIHVAKIIKPTLTQESAAYIAEEYSRLRSQDSMSSDTARVSPRGSVSLRHEGGASCSLAMGSSNLTVPPGNFLSTDFYLSLF